MDTAVSQPVSHPDAPAFVIRQQVRKSLDLIFENGLFGVNDAAPAGTLRGIDVLEITVVRQKLARAASIANAAYGTLADFSQPRGYYEKLVASKFFAPIPMPSPADKLTVDHFIPDDIKDIVQAVPSVWQSPFAHNAAQMNALGLPDGRYYLKANNGSGSVRPIELPVPDAESEALQAQTEAWLAHRHGERAGEWWYGLIGPRIFLEKDLRTSDAPVSDWKIHMGGGKVLAVQVDLGRGQNHQQFMFDETFNRLEMDLFFSGNGIVTKPDNLDQLLHAARRIGSQFEFARVDFYNVDGALYLGEITLAPLGGQRTPKSPELNTYLGKLWGQEFFSSHAT